MALLKLSFFERGLGKTFCSQKKFPPDYIANYSGKPFLILFFLGLIILAGPVSASDSTSAFPIKNHLGFMRRISTGIADIVKKVSPTVVSLRAEDSSGNVAAAGSGIILRADGYIITNFHLVGNKHRIILRYNDHDVAAEVVGLDAKTDLAVIKVPIAAMKTARIGDSKKTLIGEIVLAIGNPMGLSKSVSMGIISAKGRVNVGVAVYEDLIQTDAAFNPGSSGGALVNLEGEVIGINTAVLSDTGTYSGICFAIPIEMAVKVAEQLIAHGTVARGWLGMSVRYEDDVGVVVEKVIPSGPAFKAGLMEGDVISKFDNIMINDSYKLRNIVGRLKVGKSVQVVVIRGGELVKCKLLVGQIQQ